MFRRLSRLKLGPELSNAGVVGAEKEGEAAENTKGRKKEEPIRRMKRRLGLWKECRRTSAGGQPRAIPLSLSLSRFQNATPPSSTPAEVTENTRSLHLPPRLYPRWPPLPLSSNRFLCRPTSPSATYASTRLWWLPIPPGASLVTHAARSTSPPPADRPRADPLRQGSLPLPRCTPRSGRQVASARQRQ